MFAEICRADKAAEMLKRVKEIIHDMQIAKIREKYKYQTLLNKYDRGVFASDKQNCAKY